MVFQCGLCMLQCYILIFGVIGKMIDVKQQIQVHHIINNHREIPFSEVPRADATYIGFEAVTQVVGSLYQYGLDAVCRCQAVCVAVATVHHESDVVCTGVFPYRIQVVGEFGGTCLQVFLSGQLVGIPQVAGEETAGPVVDGSAIRGVKVEGSLCNWLQRKSMS